MQVVCQARPRAIVAETAPHSHGALNLDLGVDLDIREQMPGYDPAPVIVDYGCGRGFEIDTPAWAWDVNTEQRDDGEWVIERHLSVMCPHCGRAADYFSEPVDPFPFAHQGLSKRERLIRSDPEILDALSHLDEERAEQVIAKIVRGISGGSDVGYAHVTEGAVALSAATAKTVIGAKAGSAAGLSWSYFWLSFDGTTASAVPVLVELCYCTWASNSPGTNSTGTTERQEYGRVLAIDWTGGRNWTTEPTTLTVFGEGLLSPNGGFVVYDDPLGTEPDCALSEGFAIRLNAPAAVNVRATQKVKRV